MPKSNSNRNNHTEQLVATPSKPPSHRPTVPKAKPRSSKKSGAQKNNKVKKRGSILGDKSAPVDDDDRMDDRPAIQVEGDFTKAKPSQNQIPIQTFWSFVDQFFRPLNEEDLKILETNGDEVTPYIVPPLGRSYKEQWSIEEAKLMSQLDAEISTATTYTAPAGQEYSEVNGAVHGGDVHMKPLSERIIASLVENRITSYMTPSSPLAPGDPDKIAFRTNWDMADLEQRMRNELRYIGLIDDDESFYNVEEEDEISHELRKLQTELRERYAINRTRKLQLKEVAQRWMAYQEYNGVLDDINKNIEQAYIKRFRTPTKSKGKKKIIKGEYRPMAENVMQHLENREKLIQEVGGFFPPDQFQLPQTSIYSG
ncbi:histone acetyltransferases subunit 3-domain-containing protein [Phlyctochytrium arcticum]|nr:histone acetyltransferases subunit 3-domain-containing protein [Phlyctochytrium arcticum]